MSSSVVSTLRAREQFGEPLALAAGQTRCRFVEHHQLGLGDDDHADLELALLPVRQVADDGVELVAEPHRRGGRSCGVAAGALQAATAERAVAAVLADPRQLQVVLDGEAAEQPGLLIGAGDAERRSAS